MTARLSRCSSGHNTAVARVRKGIAYRDGCVPMTASGTPVAAGAFTVTSNPHRDQPRRVPHDSAGRGQR